MKPKTKKPKAKFVAQAYTVKDPYGNFSPFALYFSRDTAIFNYLKYEGRYTWKQAYRRGYRCVKVEVREI